MSGFDIPSEFTEAYEILKTVNLQYRDDNGPGGEFRIEVCLAHHNLRASPHNAYYYEMVGDSWRRLDGVAAAHGKEPVATILHQALHNLASFVGRHRRNG